MRLTEYRYDITDSLNNKVAVDALESEIISSDIVTSLNDIVLYTDSLVISFKEVLTVEDEDLLNNLVSNHEGEQLPENQLTKVKVFEENSLGIWKTNGNYTSKSFVIDVAEENGTYIIDYTFPYYISIISGQWYSTADMVGDELSVQISPDTLIGGITAEVPIGSTVIPVSDTVLEHIRYGYLVNINDGDNAAVYDIDLVNKTITIDTPTTMVYYPGGLIRMTVLLIGNFHFTSEGKFDIGTSKIGAEAIPPNTKIRLKYYNKTNKAKVFSLFSDFLY